jgi:hypothetical protein
MAPGPPRNTLLPIDVLLPERTLRFSTVAGTPASRTDMGSYTRVVSSGPPSRRPNSRSSRSESRVPERTSAREGTRARRPPPPGRARPRACVRRRGVEPRAPPSGREPGTRGDPHLPGCIRPMKTKPTGCPSAPRAPAAIPSVAHRPPSCRSLGGAGRGRLAAARAPPHSGRPPPAAVPGRNGHAASARGGEPRKQIPQRARAPPRAPRG